MGGSLSSVSRANLGQNCGVFQHAPPSLSSFLLLSPSPCLGSWHHAVSSLYRTRWGPSQAQTNLYFLDSARRGSSTLKLPVLGLSPSWLQNLLKASGHSLPFFLRLFGFLNGRQDNNRVSAMERASGTGIGHLGRRIVLAYVRQCGGCFEMGKRVAIINWQCCFSQGCRLLIDI